MPRIAALTLLGLRVAYGAVLNGWVAAATDR
jgi:hypothetical protein